MAGDTVPKRRLSSGTRSIPERLAALGYQSYGDYLASEHWQAVRARFFKDSARTKRMYRQRGKLWCEACRRSDVRLNLHHASYKTLGRENLGHLVLLCDDCHGRTHDLDRERRKTGHMRANLWNVTKHIRRNTPKSPP